MFRGARLCILVVSGVLSLVALLGCKSPATRLAEPIDPVQKAKPGASSLIRYQYGKNEVIQLCDLAIDKAEKDLAILAGKITPKSPADLLQFEEILADFSETVDPLSFMASVSTNTDLRKEGETCRAKSSQFGISVFARRDLYNSLKNAAPSTPAQIRLQRETLIGFEKQGLKSPDKVVREVKELMQRASDLRIKFQSNLDNDQTTVSFTGEELSGTPPEFLARLKKDVAGSYIVTTKYPDYLAVMENAKSGETRRKMSTVFQTRQALPNTKLLEDTLEIRAEIANKLGYKTWADYSIQGRMAQGGAEVLRFLNDLKTRLSQVSKRDIEKLRKFKKEMEPDSKTLNPWDLAYYEYQLKKRDYSLDNEKIREFFPADLVIQNTFDVYAKLFNVKFVPVKDADVWAPEVKLFEVHDLATKNLIAYFFADLYPRDGKYGHAAAFTLTQGRLREGKYVRPISSIVANFEPPSKDRPSLLTHDEVETFFHEFGHIMHQVLTKAEFATLAGSNVYQDFVEAPSQMLENWVWNKEILKTLSGHYTDSSKKIPDELAEKIIATKYFFKGYMYTRQLMLALFDMKLHSTKRSNTKKVYDDLFRELIGIEPLKEGYFPATFGHLMGGYDAGYYGYLWSEVYARDMFSRFEKEGLFSEQTGQDYRKYILEQGSMKHPSELLTQFLKRKPTSEAFLQMIENNIK